MSYSRSCGVSLAACGANEPENAANDADAFRDPGPLKVALSGAGEARTGDYDPTRPRTQPRSTPMTDHDPDPLQRERRNPPVNAETPADKSRAEREAQAAYRRTHSPDGHSLGSAKYPNNREGRRALARSWKRMNQ